MNNPLTTVRNEVDRLFTNLVDNPPWATITTPFTNSFGNVAIKMWETDDNLCLEADLPGVDHDDVDVTVDGRQLRISAIRHESTVIPAGPNREKIKEAYYGRLERYLTLPNTVDAESCNAELKRGVLHLTFKKTPDSKVRKITVK